MPCSVHFNCLPVFISPFTCRLICGKSKTNLKTVAFVLESRYENITNGTHPVPILLLLAVFYIIIKIK